MNCKVIKLVINPFLNESRDLREVITLAKNKYSVKVLALHKDGLLEEELHQYFTLKRLKINYANKNKKNILIHVLMYGKMLKAIEREVVEFKPYILSCHDMIALSMGYLIQKKMRKELTIKLVYDSHELEIHRAGKYEKSKVVRYIKSNLEHFLISKSAKMMVVNTTIAEYIQTLYNLEETPCVVRSIPDTYSSEDRNNLFNEKFNISNSSKIILYQGMITRGRGIENTIKAVAHMDKTIVLVVMGRGDSKLLIKLVKELALSDRVFFHDEVPYNELPYYTSSADLGISLIENISLSYYYSLPNKFFEYINAGIPIVCSDFPEMKALVNGYKIGETVNPNDIIEISKTIERVLLVEEAYAHYKENIRIAKKALTWEKEQRILLDMYESL